MTDQGRTVVPGEGRVRHKILHLLNLEENERSSLREYDGET